jgi:hypothetical protein
MYAGLVFDESPTFSIWHKPAPVFSNVVERVTTMLAEGEPKSRVSGVTRRVQPPVVLEDEAPLLPPLEPATTPLDVLEDVPVVPVESPELLPELDVMD